MLPTKKRIGIIGGGQLGKMLIEASRPWNTHNVVLEAEPHCPAALVADDVVVGSLQDGEKIRELASVCDVLTFEIEHINVEALLALEAAGKQVIPSPKVLEIIQDKGRQKEFFSTWNLPTAPFFIVHSKQGLEAIASQLGDTFVIKQRRGGYDGKGVLIAEKKDIPALDAALFESAVIEQYYGDIVEYAVIVARDGMGEVQCFPLIEMYFNPVSNLVEFLFSPARVEENLEEKCKILATQAIEAFDGVGIFAVELFVTGKGELLINEIAPRPHNSGHHTIEGCYTSQFEQLNRILLGLPLGDSSMVCPAAMLNLIGPEGLEGNYALENAEALLKIPGVYIHLYNKKSIKPHRKMGHITILADTVETLIEKAEKVRELAGFVAA